MSALTPANQITLLRLALIPAFALLLIYGHLGAAFVVFVVAGATDALDGYIARRLGQQSTLGAWLDPMADKLLLTTAFVVLTLPIDHLANRLPVWLTVLVISRDIGIVATVAIVNLAVGRQTFMPSIWGKLATAVYVATGAVTMYFNAVYQRSIVVDVCVWLSLAVTLLSGLHYIWRATRVGPH